MAEDKKGFLLYADQRGIFEKLDNEQAGKLIKHIFSYVNDEDPKGDFVTELAFESIKNQLKRDLKKYDKIRAKRSEAGKKSAEKRKQQKQQVLTSVESVEQTSTNPTVIDNVNVNVNDNVRVNDNVKGNKQTKDIMSRKQIFATSLEPYLENYGKEMLNEFYHYWTEHNDNGKKMRFEYAKNQPFNVSRRLVTWAKRNKEQPIQGKGTKKRGEGVDEDYIQELYNRINNSDE